MEELRAQDLVHRRRVAMRKIAACLFCYCLVLTVVRWLYDAKVLNGYNTMLLWGAFNFGLFLLALFVIFWPRKV